MNEKSNTSKEKSPVSAEEIKKKIRAQCEETINFCTEKREESFYSLEKTLMKLVSQLGCLFLQLFLTVCHQQLVYDKWLSSGLYYAKKRPISRVIKTVYGQVRYWRIYLIRKEGGVGFYPLDAVLGLTSDGFTPWVISAMTKLATRVSFGTSAMIFHYFCGWSASIETIEEMVLGLGGQGKKYMKLAPPSKDDGEILVIECDGKATPTATKKELEKRRGKRKKKQPSCCKRHRGRLERRMRKRKRRKKGDKSKNGRSITLVCMYTLKKGEDGQLHGPINKKVWGSYAPRKHMIKWAREQADKRAFHKQSGKQVHIVIDGEICLEKELRKLFPNASFALDIRHIEEKVWSVGRLFHKEGSEELDQWVHEKTELLYSGRLPEFLFQLKEIKKTLSVRAKRDANKLKELGALIEYAQKRINMMAYDQLIEQDLPIASGIIEGAVRYVIGQRMDCGGMRWIPGRAEALLHLRCIELNGEWDAFFSWVYQEWIQKLRYGEKVVIHSDQPLDLSGSEEISKPVSEMEVLDLEVCKVA